MARAIADTPTITGEDARRFRREMFASFMRGLTEEGKNERRKEKEEIQRAYNLMLSISNGTFR